jgi:hypothetical protein
MSKSNTNTGTEEANENEYTVPEKWDDLDPTLIPILEQPSEWFSEVLEAYETAYGQMGKVLSLTPEAITFGVRVTDEMHHIKDLYQTYIRSTEQDGTLLVHNKEESESKEDPTLWMNRNGNSLFIRERVPFEDRVTTPVDLHEELNNIMYHQPHWEDTFDRAVRIAGDMGLSPSVPTLTWEDYLITFKILEKGRDKASYLTPNQKDILNEAHTIAQEMYSQKEIHDPQGPLGHFDDGSTTKSGGFSPKEFNMAFGLLETGRDEVDHLTPTQQDTLNEAHVVVQEMHSIQVQGN